MINKRTLIASIVAVSSVSLVLAFSLLQVPFLNSVTTDPAEPAPETSNSVDLGITYLKITPEVSACYGLEVDSGILVTEVKPGSFMDQAQVKSGDIICSCNGVVLDNDASLLGLLRMCSPDDTFTFEVCRGGECHSVEFCQNCGTSECTCGCSSLGDE